MSYDASSSIRFENTLLITAAFPLPSKQARALLPTPTRLNLVEVLPGQAVLVVSFAHYRTSPFGSYSEAILALMTSHEKTKPMLTLAGLLQQSRYPAYVLHMLVSSAEAERQGSKTWALPRLLADVHLDEQKQQTICQAALDEQNVLRMVTDRPATDRTRTMQIDTYSQREETLLCSVMHCEAGAYGRTQGSSAAITWGPHPIGQQMASLDIGAQPIMMRHYDQMQAQLSAPEIVV